MDTHRGGEGAKYWLGVLTEVKNRGVEDVCITVCDGLKSLPDAITAVWPLMIVQTCIIHLLRNSFKYASRKYWSQISTDLKPIYTAINADDTRYQFEEFTQKWGNKYPAIIKLWENVWEEFIPFLNYDVEIRKAIYSTNEIESLNAKYCKAIRARVHFSTVEAALKCLYLVTRSLDPTGKNQQKWITRWKAPLNAFHINFPQRIK